MIPVDVTHLMAPGIWLMVGLFVLSVLGMLGTHYGWFRRAKRSGP